MAAALLSAAWMTDARAENRALLVGVGKYRVSEADLPGIDKDIKMMKQVVKKAGFTDGQIRVLRDRAATLAGIEQAIEDWIIAGVESTDRALFYFSGHGSQIPDKNGDEVEDHADEVLLPHDMGVAGRTLTNTFVDDRFGEILARIPAKEILVFIDACHSGTSTKQLDFFGDEKPKLFYYKGMPMSDKDAFAVEGDSGGVKGKYVALSASRDDQTALATSRGSLFTRGLLDAVEKAEESGDNPTIETLRERATTYILNNVSSKKKQHHPQLAGDRTLAKKIRIFMSDGVPPLWDKLSTLAERAPHKIDVWGNKNRYRIGDQLVFHCNVDRDGYLNVLEVSPGNDKATVLFPNRYHPDNYVTGGNRITIPAEGDKFKLTARKPKKSMIVVVQTGRPLNAYKSGEGKVTALFKTLSERDAFEVESASEEPFFAAGKFVTRVE